MREVSLRLAPGPVLLPATKTADRSPARDLADGFVSRPELVERLVASRDAALAISRPPRATASRRCWPSGTAATTSPFAWVSLDPCDDARLAITSAIAGALERDRIDRRRRLARADVVDRRRRDVGAAPADCGRQAARRRVRARDRRRAHRYRHRGMGGRDRAAGTARRGRAAGGGLPDRAAAGDRAPASPSVADRAADGGPGDGPRAGREPAGAGRARARRPIDPSAAGADRGMAGGPVSGGAVAAGRARPARRGQAPARRRPPDCRVLPRRAVVAPVERLLALPHARFGARRPLRAVVRCGARTDRRREDARRARRART